MTRKKIPDVDMSEEGLFAFLPVSLQQAVARGEIDLDELLESLTDPEAELCPICAQRPQTMPNGLCFPCHKRRLTDKARETLADLQAEREARAVRKAVQRLRDELEPDRPRRAGPYSKTSSDYGRAELLTTNEPLPIVRCERCGRPVRQHDDEVLCLDCLELLESRAAYG